MGGDLGVLKLGGCVSCREVGGCVSCRLVGGCVSEELELCPVAVLCTYVSIYFFELCVKYDLTMSRTMTCVSLLDIQSHLQLKEATTIIILLIIF